MTSSLENLPNYNRLRDYQQNNVRFIMERKTVGVFSQQRTGKTPTVCVALNGLACTRTVIVCPASLMLAWRDEWNNWVGDTALIVTNTEELNKQIFTTNITAIICSYEKVRGRNSKDDTFVTALLKAKPNAVVLDEAHRMKNRKTATYNMLKKLNKIPVRIAMTGTPAPNKPWDVWAIMNWIAPGTYRSYWKFIDTYFTTVKNYVGHETHDVPTGYIPGMEEILSMNLDLYCVQDKRKDVMSWLGDEPEPIVVRLDCLPKQKEAIESLMNYYSYHNIVTKTDLDNMTRVRQLCSAAEILGLNIKSPKIKWVHEYIADYPEQSILLFSHSKKFLYLLMESLKGIPRGIICGDVPQEQREKIKQSFQQGKIKILLLQIDAAKEGLTLDQADVSIFLDACPPAATYAQAKDRMVATTPERAKPKTIIHVMMADTYDEELFKLVEHNTLATAVINDYKKYLNQRRQQNG